MVSNATTHNIPLPIPINVPGDRPTSRSCVTMRYSVSLQERRPARGHSRIWQRRVSLRSVQAGLRLEMRVDVPPPQGTEQGDQSEVRGSQAGALAGGSGDRAETEAVYNIHS